MEKERLLELRRRVLSGATAMGIAISGYGVTKLDSAKACEPEPLFDSACDCFCQEEYEPIKVQKPKSKYGTYVDPETDIEYNTVIVEKGDNASKLSSRVVHYFIEHNEVPADEKAMYNEDYDTRARFWPVIVYLNTEEGKKYHSREGEKFIFPKTYEELVALNIVLKKSGWLANYVQNNNVYPKKKVYKVPKEQTRKYVECIYREAYEDPCFVVTDELLEAYLKAHSYDGKFVFDKNSKLNKNEKFILTEWIPTLEELNQYMPKKPKTKHKKCH